MIINVLVFIIDMECVLCEIASEVFHSTLQKNVSVQRVRLIYCIIRTNFKTFRGEKVP